MTTPAAQKAERIVGFSNIFSKFRVEVLPMPGLNFAPYLKRGAATVMGEHGEKVSVTADRIIKMANKFTKAVQDAHLDSGGNLSPKPLLVLYADLMKHGGLDDAAKEALKPAFVHELAMLMFENGYALDTDIDAAFEPFKKPLKALGIQAAALKSSFINLGVEGFEGASIPLNIEPPKSMVQAAGAAVAGATEVVEGVADDVVGIAKKEPGFLAMLGRNKIKTTAVVAAALAVGGWVLMEADKKNKEARVR